MIERRIVKRFKTHSIILHWVQAASFVVIGITGLLMLFHVTGFQEGYTVRVIHLVSAAMFVGIPAMYSLFYPTTASGFLRESFHWDKNDLSWLVLAPRYYFGGREDAMPPHDRINGDQKLWQINIIISCLVLLVSGVVLWFFRMSIPVLTYQMFLLAHGTAFLLLSLGFLSHFYLTSFHPYFEESLSSMIDGKVSSSYAQKHYSKWFDNTVGNNKDINTN